MKKFDKILNFLFHTKLGIATLLVSITSSIFVMSGCLLADFLACYCDFFWCGTGDIFDGCTTCYEPSDDYGSMCACGTWGVCNDSCGGSSSSSSSSSSNGGCADSCDNGSTSFNSRIFVTYNLGDFGIFSQSYSADNAIANDDVIVSPSDVADYSTYFELSGFYTESGKKVIDADGKVVDSGEFKKKVDFELYARGTERYFEDVVTIYFDTTSTTGQHLNPVKVVVGGPIDVFRSVPETYNGAALTGWRVKDGSSSTNYPIVEIIEGKTIFHLYSFRATPGEEIVLEPVYNGKKTTSSNSGSSSSNSSSSSRIDYNYLDTLSDSQLRNYYEKGYFDSYFNGDSDTALEFSLYMYSRGIFVY